MEILVFCKWVLEIPAFCLMGLSATFGLIFFLEYRFLGVSYYNTYKMLFALNKVFLDFCVYPHQLEMNFRFLFFFWIFDPY